MSDDTPGRITGLGGIFFKVRDPAASLAWYQSKLGIQPAPDFPGSILRWRDSADPTKECCTIWSLFSSETDYFGPPGGANHMVNYRVDDLDALLAKLSAAGVTVLPQRDDSSLGRFAWILDPDGHRIELWQPPEGM